MWHLILMLCLLWWSACCMQCQSIEKRRSCLSYSRSWSVVWLMCIKRPGAQMTRGPRNVRKPHLIFSCIFHSFNLLKNSTKYYLISHLWPTGGAQRTPVKQKMKTMSRSLQMLNVAWLNVKAQKNQAEQLGVEARAPDRQGKRRSSDRNKPEGASTIRECAH